MDRISAALADRYRIERELGRGGMATVYLAEDLKHDRKVALKVLHPELAAVLGSERFLQEIKITAQLQHPHILPLFDSGEADDFLYYVMPYVEGETNLRPRFEQLNTLLNVRRWADAHRLSDALSAAHPDHDGSAGYRAWWFLYARGDVDSARMALRATPEGESWVFADAAIARAEDQDAWSYTSLGLALALAGDGQGSHAACAHAMELRPASRDHVHGTSIAVMCAYAQARSGDTERALDAIERLVRIPWGLTVWELRLDPRWDFLRSHPRFQALIA